MPVQVIVLRSAGMDDMHRVFAWRNDPATRQYFLDPRPITWEEHSAWFDKVLQRDDVHLLIGEMDGEPVGVLRFDVAGASAEVSVYLVPGLTGKGIGHALLEAGSRWAAISLPEVAALTARILSGNIASLKAFEKAGFVETCRIFEYDLASLRRQEQDIP